MFYLSVSCKFTSSLELFIYITLIEVTSKKASNILTRTMEYRDHPKNVPHIIELQFSFYASYFLFLCRLVGRNYLRTVVVRGCGAGCWLAAHKQSVSTVHYNASNNTTANFEKNTSCICCVNRWWRTEHYLVRKRKFSSDVGDWLQSERLTDWQTVSQWGESIDGCSLARCFALLSEDVIWDL